MKHLWECGHPYYCNQGNYYASGRDQPVTEYKRWADFIAEEADADLDYNLVFRWDWKEDDGFDGDINYRNGKLFVFFMGQRKGLYRWAEVEVCRADEPAVIEYLKPRWEHMQRLWEPFHPPHDQGSDPAEQPGDP
jgi:hypothetical protein